MAWSNSRQLYLMSFLTFFVVDYVKYFYYVFKLSYYREHPLPKKKKKTKFFLLLMTLIITLSKLSTLHQMKMKFTVLIKNFYFEENDKKNSDILENQ